MMIWAGVYLVIAYLIGAIPSGYLIAKQVKGIDIRQHGSGNVGGTNVTRVVGKKAGYATLLCDFLKGLVVVLAARLLFSNLIVDTYQIFPMLAGVAAIFGHSRSVFIGFTGGKSVITSLGAILALEPLAALTIGVLSVIIVKLTRYVSIGSITGAVLLPCAIWLFNGPPSHVIMCGFISLYVIYLHRSNIERLLQHRENRI